MGITIYAPGIELKITDANKVNFVCNAATSIMDNIFYNRRLKLGGNNGKRMGL